MANSEVINNFQSFMMIDHASASSILSSVIVSKCKLILLNTLNYIRKQIISILSSTFILLFYLRQLTRWRRLRSNCHHYYYYNECLINMTTEWGRRHDKDKQSPMCMLVDLPVPRCLTHLQRQHASVLATYGIQCGVRHHESHSLHSCEALSVST